MILYILYLSLGVLARMDTTNIHKGVKDSRSSDLYILVGMLPLEVSMNETDLEFF